MALAGMRNLYMIFLILFTALAGFLSCSFPLYLSMESPLVDYNFPRLEWMDGNGISFDTYLFDDDRAGSPWLLPF
jgi:hypothetical protein